MPTGFSTLGKGRGRMGSKVRMFLDPRNLATMNAKMRNAVNIALDTATPLLRKKAQDIKRRSKEIVPYRSGDLRKAIHYRVVRGKISVSADIWYDENQAVHRGFKYAWIQHETPDPPWSHTGDRQWHYLSDPLEEAEGDMDEIWIKSFKDVWKY